MPNIPSIKIGNTTYKVKDEVAREHLIEVSNTQPSSTDNRLWIKNAENEYQVPTYEEFSDLKSALNGDFDSIMGTEIIEFTSGYIDTQSETVDPTAIIPTTTDFMYAVVPCSDGEIFTINGTGGIVPRLWAFINDNVENNKLSVANKSVTANNLEIAAPTGATKLIINVNAKPVKPCYRGQALSEAKNKIDYSDSVRQIRYWGEDGSFADYYGITAKRVGNLISIKGTATSGVTIRLSGSIQRSNGGSVIRAWAKTINLKENTKYSINASVISGNFSGQISFALRNESNNNVSVEKLKSIHDSVSNCDLHIGENCMLIVTIPSGTVVDATFAVCLTEMTNIIPWKIAKNNTEKLISVDDKINRIGHIVKFYDSEYEQYANARGMDVKINNDIVLLDGDTTGYGQVWFRLTDGIESATAVPYNTWGGIASKTLTKGHKYELSVHKLSGSSGSYLMGIYSQSGEIIVSGINDQNKKTFIFNDDYYGIYILVANTQVLNKLTLQVQLQDLTSNEDADQCLDQIGYDKTIHVNDIDQPLESLIVMEVPTLNGDGWGTPDNPKQFIKHNDNTIYISEYTDGEPENEFHFEIGQSGNMIYGYRYDAVTGKMEVTHKGIVIDGINVAFRESEDRYSFSHTDLTNAVNAQRMIGNWLPPIVFRVNKKYGFSYGYKSDFASLGIQSLEALNQKCAETNLIVVYELETPEIITLTEATSILPVTESWYAWADYGDVFASYYRDIKSYVDNKSKPVNGVLYATDGISQNPQIVVPKRMISVKETLITDATRLNGIEVNRTNGIASDGIRHVFYALGSGSNYALRKVDTETGKVVATAQLADHGHYEDICFVPSWVSGFDNGNVDRIYCTDLNMSQEHPTGYYVNVFDAKSLKLIGSFSSASIVTHSWWRGARELTFNAKRGMFAIATDSDSSAERYAQICLFDTDGNPKKICRFTKWGTMSGIDSDENFIYVTNNSGGFQCYLFDWDLNPVARSEIDEFSWELEGMCHIGSNVFLAWNHDDKKDKNVMITKAETICDYFPIGSEKPFNWTEADPVKYLTLEKEDLT